MKNNQIILEFRKAFRRLDYAKNKMTVWELEVWSKTWCRQNGISEDLYINFRTLAFAYAEEEMEENYLSRVV